MIKSLLIFWAFLVSIAMGDSTSTLLPVITPDHRSEPYSEHHSTGEHNRVNLKPILIVSGCADAGLGDYSYGWNLYQYLTNTFPEHSTKMLFYGTYRDRIKVQKAFDIDFKTHFDVLWLTIDSDTDSDEEDYSQPEAYKQKSKNRITRVRRENKQSRAELKEFVKKRPATVFITAKLETVNGELQKQLDITPDLDIDHLNSMKKYIPSGYAWQTFSETLSSMNYYLSPNTEENSLFKRSWLGSAESYTKHCSDRRDDPVHIQHSSIPDLNSVDLYEFGLSSDKEIVPYNRYLGLMLPEALKKEAEDYHDGSTIQRQSLLEYYFPAAQHPQWLSVLTGKTDPEQHIKWLEEEANYFIAYIQDLIELMSFIALSAPMVDPEQDLKYIINITEDPIEWSDYKHWEPWNWEDVSWSTLERRALLYPLLKNNNIARVVYWSPKKGMQQHEITSKGRTLWLIDPFPMKKNQFNMLGIASKYPIIGCTGDNSFYEVVASGKIPFHENVPHLHDFHQRLATLADKQGFQNVKDYFCTVRVDSRRQSLIELIETGEWSAFVNYLFEHENAYSTLKRIMSKLLDQ